MESPTPKSTNVHPEEWSGLLSTENKYVDSDVFLCDQDCCCDVTKSDENEEIENANNCDLDSHDEKWRSVSNFDIDLNVERMNEENENLDRDMNAYNSKTRFWILRRS